MAIQLKMQILTIIMMMNTNPSKEGESLGDDDHGDGDGDDIDDNGDNDDIDDNGDDEKFT